jgi:hypothetical protein
MIGKPKVRGWNRIKDNRQEMMKVGGSILENKGEARHRSGALGERGATFPAEGSQVATARGIVVRRRHEQSTFIDHFPIFSSHLHVVS